jgi:hypothetical protein
MLVAHGSAFLGGSSAVHDALDDVDRIAAFEGGVQEEERAAEDEYGERTHLWVQKNHAPRTKKARMARLATDMGNS